jgi:hypothetical protein
MNIEANIKRFMSDRKPEQRYASFDYCFNYFQSFRESGDTADIAAPGNMLYSCLQLGFYLASWGMFRASSDLPGRSLKQFEPTVRLIAGTSDDIWAIDADSYSEPACGKLINTANAIRKTLRHPDGDLPTETLATKVMLGVFGNVPAFDSRVVAGLRKTPNLTGQFSVRALRAIGRFYDEHNEVIERHREYTLEFATGQPTQRRYTRAKVIDQIFFIEGRDSNNLSYA